MSTSTFLPSNWSQMKLVDQQAWLAQHSSFNLAFLPTSQIVSTAGTSTGTAGATAAAGAAGSGSSLIQSIAGYGSQGFGVFSQINAQKTQTALTLANTQSQQAQLASNNAANVINRADNTLKSYSTALNAQATASDRYQAILTSNSDLQSKIAARTDLVKTALEKDLTINLSANYGKSAGSNSGELLQALRDPSNPKVSQSALDTVNRAIDNDPVILNLKARQDSLNQNLAKIDLNSQTRQLDPIAAEFKASQADLIALRETVTDPVQKQQIQSLIDRGSDLTPFSATATTPKPGTPASFYDQNNISLIGYSKPNPPFTAGQAEAYFRNNGGQVLYNNDGTVTLVAPNGTQISEEAALANINGTPAAVSDRLAASSVSMTPTSKAIPDPKNAGLLSGFGGVATEAGAGFGLWTSVRSGNIAGALASFAGLYAGMKLITNALSDSLNMAKTYADGTHIMAGSFGSFFNKVPGLSQAYDWIMGHPLFSALAVAAIITALALLFSKKANAAEQQIANYDNLTVWSTGKVLTMASASAFLALGYNINTASPNISGPGIPIPVSTLKMALATGLSNADGSAYSGDIPYNTPIVLKGQAAGGGDQVLVVTPGGIQNGKATDSLKVYNLSNNMTFSKGTDKTGAYIPFFVNGQVNPQAVAANNNQTTILKATTVLTPSGQVGGVTTAAAMNKSDVGVLSGK